MADKTPAHFVERCLDRAYQNLYRRGFYFNRRLWKELRSEAFDAATDFSKEFPVEPTDAD